MAKAIDNQHIGLLSHKNAIENLLQMNADMSNKVANAYLVAKATSALSTMTHQMTPVPEGATFEEKYNSLLQDFKNLQYAHECLESNHRSMKTEIHKRMLEIQTANTQIKDLHENIHHTLLTMQIGLSLS